MHSGSLRQCRLWLPLALAACVSPAAIAHTYHVGPSVGLAWAPAGGTVWAYLVQVSEDGGPFQFYSYVPTNQSVITGRLDHALQVRVAAVRSVGLGLELSEWSDPSTRIQLVEELPAPVARSDFDGNGRMDLLWGDSLGGGYQLWSESSVRTFAGPGAFWRVESLADFDGDGKSDVLWRDALADVVAITLANLPRGSALPTPHASLVLGDDWVIVGTGDHDGDGRADVLAHRPGRLWMLLMDGPEAVANQKWNIDPTWVVVGSGDYDGDLHADILWRHTGNGSLRVWFMDGFELVAQRELGVATLAGDELATGDFDGDGRDELSHRRAESGDVSFWSLSRGGLTVSPVVRAMHVRWRIEAVGDRNGDGRSDLIWRLAVPNNDRSGEVRVWLMDGAQVAEIVDLQQLPLQWDLARSLQ